MWSIGSAPERPYVLAFEQGPFPSRIGSPTRPKNERSGHTNRTRPQIESRNYSPSISFSRRGRTKKRLN
ncbi:protein of unknown function [Burkholderia multivorans]